MDAADIPPQDMTLDELREALAPRLAAEAAFDGWSDTALAAASHALDVPVERARLSFPDGAVDLIAAWFGAIDRAMVARFAPDELASMRMRTRIESLVWARITLAADEIEALRRALAILALPANAPQAARLVWHAADQMWRLAGDTATGFAYYSKRATLAGVYSATILALLADESEDRADTRAFLSRRIDGVMRFEKLKAQLKPHPDRHFSPARFLGRLRYPAQ